MKPKRVSGKQRDRYLEALGLREATIVHFDISRARSDVRWKLHRFLHGRVDQKRANGRSRSYRYPGLLHEGGIRLGQSVYLLPPDLASRLIVKLRDLGVKHEWWDIYSSA
jgi:hypothetical protein